MPVARHAWARYRRHKYEQRIQGFLRDRTGRADRLPQGAVYEATMRCNLHCEFCYVLDFLNIEGEWREEMTVDRLRQAFPDRAGFQVSLTGGEIFMRKDILSVLDLFKEKGYSCGYLTTNGTIISDERADALADLAAAGFLKHISVSVDGPGDLHDRARGLKGTFTRTTAGLRRLQEAARRRHAPLRVSINTTVAHESLEALDQMVDVADELGVDAIGLNHLMYSTPEEVAETVRIIGAKDASVIATFVTPDPGPISRACGRRSARSPRSAGRATSSSTTAPRCTRRSSRTTTRPAPGSKAVASIPFSTPGSASPARYTSVRSSASKSVISRPRRSKRSGTDRPTSRCDAGWSSTGSFRSAAAAARWNSRPSRLRSRFLKARRRGAPFL
jgi:organic radical activating enzyme